MDEETHPIITSTDTPRKPLAPCCGYSLVKAVLALGLFLALSAVVILVIALGFTVSSINQQAHCQQCNESNTTDDSICLTPSCVELAASFLKNMNDTVDPCEDFYNFTCGGWDERNIVPPGYPRFSTFDELGKRNTIALKKILDSGRDDGVEAVKKVIDLYQSCLNTTAIDLAAAQPLLELLNHTGGWSLLTGKDSGWNINGSSFLAEKFYGSPAFFSLDVGIDDKNSSKHIIEVQQSGLSLASPSTYLDNRTAPLSTSALKTLMVTVLTLIDSSVDSSVYEGAADEIIELESRLAEIFYGNVELRDIDKTYNLKKLGELSSLWPSFNWINFTTVLFDDVGVELNASEVVIVRTPKYFENLTNIFDSTNRSVLENYAKWQLIMSYLPYLSDNFLNAYYKFTKTTEGTGEQERYTTCIGIVQDILPIALARPYSKYVLPEGTRGNVSEIVENVKSAFKERLDSNQWLDAQTKALCKDKVDAITKQVAYPEQLFNDTYLNGLYEQYNISAEDYFGNYRRSVGVMLEDNYRQLRGDVDKKMWLNAPTAVNAYYDPQFNGFVFLEGILNVPFFEAGWPDYSKYGALGVVVGHELTHGFDDQGQRYNKDGILTPWWTNSSVKNFDDRKECFVEQYSKYELFGYNVNGSLTLGENIADNGGVKSSFQAYKDLVERKQVKEQTLPGLDKYSPEQLYFISFGQVWCSLFTPEAISVSTKTDPHSPGPFRIIGSLVNSPEFASAFQCPAKSRMNPDHKCLLW